ncbi:BTAD domain-containing putative transcriptional regulator [Streptomyces sp. NPDC051132]|uniref:AfsR/SARP family transcriptional regulator n=1 Tax=unclassified Streptomyces TaxID=2593676 RepID=UPI00342D7390
MSADNVPRRTVQDSASFLTLLGGFQLQVDQRGVYLPPSAQRLLAYLALHNGVVCRDQAAELLWPNLPRARAGASLRSALWRISRRSSPHPVVDLDTTRLSLCSRVSVDLPTASRYAVALANGSGDDPPGEEIPGILREELLPSWYDDWLVDAREHFHQLRLHALEAASRHHRSHGRLCTALMYAMTAAEAEPLRESAHREITAVHLAEGNATEALRHFTSYRHRLHRELGLPPSTEYRRLISPYLGRQPSGRG